jgi:hypothetical protein
VTIKPTDTVRNLGVLFDKSIDLKQHITATCKSANYHLYNIGRLRKYLTKEACETLVHAFITTKLDYCNSLFYGLPDLLLRKLQKIQNTAARIVCRLPKIHHITPSLKSLHWLPVKERIEFKVLLIVYKALNGCAPDYISELLTPYHPNRPLRPRENMALCELRSNYESYGGRAFKISAPKLWNKLPKNIRDAKSVLSFKNLLKKHLFGKAFGP